MAKGMMFSLGFFFLAALLLVLAVLLFNSSQDTEMRASEIGVMIRLGDIHSSLEKTVRDISADKSGRSFSVSNATVTVSQQLQNPSANNFIISMQELKSYVEADDPSINLNLSNLDEFEIFPHNYIYNQDDNASTLTLTPSSLNYDSYSFTLTLLGNQTGNINFDTFTAGSFPITVNLVNGSSDQTDTELVDITQDVSISLDITGTDDVTIDITSQVVQIQNNIGQNLPLTTEISFINSLTESKVTYPSLLSVTDNDFNISLQGPVVLHD